MTTIPLDPRDFWPLAAAVSLALLTLVILFALSATAGSYRRPAWEDVPESWRGTAIFLGLLWLGLFALTVVAAYVGVWDMIHPEPDEAGPSGLGLGALLAAMLGSPFVIWGTWLKYQTVRFQKEGHMTDRISKAVEQLGAEKTVDRIGRPVTIWRGEPDTFSCRVSEIHKFETRPRTKIGPKEWSEHFDEETGQVDKDYWRDVTTWQEERTVIQWQGEDIFLADGEVVGVEGEWQAFSETAPNIEVRIGAILSLERIAQDSTIHDKGRDHVRVMEILCAYVRENSNAQKPVDYPEPDWVPLNDKATTEERAEHAHRRRERFGNTYLRTPAFEWTMSLGEPRTDVALALRVIGRRTAVQRIVEAAWPAAPGPETIWPFDLPCPELPDAVGSAATTSAELEAFRARLAQWKTKIANYKGYKLDLTRANLQGADLSAKRPDASDAVFSGAILTGARLEGANLRQTRAEGAYALVARMEGATLEDARFDGAYLAWARMEGIHAKEARMRGAVLNDSELNGAQLVKTRMEGAIFWGARMECAELIEARMEGASLLTTGMEEANLRNARLEGSSLMGTQIDGAYLRQARLDGADIWEVQFERVKGLEQAAISDAAFRSVDLSEVAFSPVQIASTFGDASVELPSEMNWPAHWPKWDLSVTDGNLFEAEWRKWRAAPAAYVPPPPPGGTPN